MTGEAAKAPNVPLKATSRGIGALAGNKAVERFPSFGLIWKTGQTVQRPFDRGVGQELGKGPTWGGFIMRVQNLSRSSLLQFGVAESLGSWFCFSMFVSKITMSIGSVKNEVLRSVRVGARALGPQMQAAFDPCTTHD